MFTKQDLVDMELGRWIRNNPTKTFAIATPTGVHCFRPEFIKDDGKLKGIEASMWAIDDSLNQPIKSDTGPAGPKKGQNDDV